MSLDTFLGWVGGWPGGSRNDNIAQLRQTKFELGLSLASINNTLFDSSLKRVLSNMQKKLFETALMRVLSNDLKLYV